MKRKISKQILCALVVPCVLFLSVPARADFWGGDVVVLTQILAQATATVAQLQAVLSTGQDTLGLLQRINKGVGNGLEGLRGIDPQFNPGTYGNLQNPTSALHAVQEIYGADPKGMDHDLIESQDQSVAEVISMNRRLYDYAQKIDQEKNRILFQAQAVNPRGAGQLENQALAVLIGVTTELLRTQSQMLKLTAENLALSTRKEKIETENVYDNYGAISRDFKRLPKTVNLPKFGQGNNSASNGIDSGPSVGSNFGGAP